MTTPVGYKNTMGSLIYSHLAEAYVLGCEHIFRKLIDCLKGFTGKTSLLPNYLQGFYTS